MTPQTREYLILDLLDGSISPEDLVELEREFTSNPEAMQQYLAYADLNNLLEVETEIARQKSSNVVPIDLIIRRQKIRNIRVALFSAAAVILIAAVSMSLFLAPENPPTLAFVTTPGTQFTISHDSSTEAPVGQVLENGSRLVISQGSIELNFRSGVKTIVTAPADLTLHSDSELHFNEGSAWFNVPEKAVGFQVSTRDFDVVDLGTQFGVFSSPNHHDEVHVFKGKVEVTAKRVRKESAILSVGEARRIDPIGRLDAISTKPEAFLSSLPSTLPHLHWSFDNDRDLSPSRGNYAGVQINTSVVEPENQSGSTVITTEGVHGSAIHSLGKGGKVISDWPGIRANQARSLSFWIKLDADAPRANGSLLGWGDRYLDDEATPSEESTASFYSFLNVSGDQTRIGLSAGRYWITGTRSIADSLWHHIVCVYDGTSDSEGRPNLKIYIDAQPETVTKHHNRDIKVNKKRGAALNTKVDTSTSVPLTIFSDLWDRDESGNKINAGIDELFVIKGAVSEAQIAELYQNNRLEPSSQ